LRGSGSRQKQDELLSRQSAFSRNSKDRTEAPIYLDVLNMTGAKVKSLADVEVELWKKGVLIDYAYFFNSDIALTGPIDSRHKVDPKLLENFKDRLDEARGRKFTGRERHHALGELGEYFASIMFGIALHKDRYAEGSDGKFGNDFVEVKTITPGKKRDVAWFKRARNFSKIVVVKITSDFQFGARLADRSVLKNHPGKNVQLSWDEMIAGSGERMLEVHRNFPMVKPAARNL
jgi:hypothetical protein